MIGRARLAWNVRRLRTSRGLTQEKLAVDARVAAPYLSRIERGTVNPTIDILDRLAAALDVSSDTLLLAIDPMDEAPEPLRPGRKRRKPL